MFSEQDVDRELQAALSVSPSPDFEARVLERVEAEGCGAQRRWWSVVRGLKTAGLPMAASIIIVAGLFYAMKRTPVVVAPPAPPATPAIVAHAGPPAPESAPVRPRVNTIDRPRVQTVQVSRRPPRAGRPEGIVPEVIVVNQMEAVRRLVRAVNEGRLAAPTSAVEAAVMVPLKDVAIASLVVDAITVPALEPDADAPSPIIRGHQ